MQRLARIEHGELRLVDAQGEVRFGRQRADCPLSATLRVSDPRFYAETAFGGSVGAGESYIRGAWGCDDLTALVRIMVRNREILEGIEGGLARSDVPCSSCSTICIATANRAACATLPRTMTSAMSCTA